jgi:glycosyltransferase involved in cell wall biosynthesis
VLAVSSLCEQKNHAMLIDAMAEVENATLIIAGDGELRTDLEQRAATQGTDVRMLGGVDPSDVRLWLGACDVFALPSLFEGRSPALPEADALAPTIVASDIPENVEVLEDRPEYCAPTDRPGWSAVLRRALDEPAPGARESHDGWSADDMVESIPGDPRARSSRRAQRDNTRRAIANARPMTRPLSEVVCGAASASNARLAMPGTQI